MTANDLQKAALVFFAARETGCRDLQQMRAICYVIRNRLRQGWAENWLTLIETAGVHAGNDPLPDYSLDLQNRNLQLLARDIDQIFFGDSYTSDPIAEAVSEVRTISGKKRNPPLYYCFADRPIRDWFTSRIIRDQENHQNSTQVGFMMLYE